MYSMVRRRTRQQAGFTLVEMLVVTAIIGLLISVITVQLQVARLKQRDAEREQEVKTLQNALALYASSNANYPVTTAPTPLTGTDAVSIALRNAETISNVPLDPLNTGNYRYVYDSVDGSTYIITYHLEGDSIPQKSAGIQYAAP